MSNQRSVTLNGLVLPNVILILVFIAMIMVGAYMTNHYYQAHFPQGINQASSICDINAFWSCDKATKSELGSFFNVPTSVVAIILGLFGLLACFMGKRGMEQTLKLILIVNLLACIALAIYSLTMLGGLCLMCTVFYVLSGIAVFMLFKFSDIKPGFDANSFGIFVVIALIPSLLFGFNISQKKSETNKRVASMVSEFQKLKSYGEAPYVSPYRLASATEDFNDAPIRVTIFSDFQCPFCKVVGEQFHKIIKKYKGKINVQYMFYPLDNACNSEVKRAFHQYACQAAYLAACDVDQFEKIHDHIFANQSKLNYDNLKKWQDQFGLSGCFENKDVQDVVQQTLNAGKFYKLKSTPTMIINGKKIEGGIDTPVIEGIFNSLL
ncbi:MAG: hypothetical protein CME62_14750 [Halobacteriovoraceae bacterium]|nr:hypothetical protein [Halobacteriovoraceae bacterium]|tara:strand:+ start:20282 stop:21421 length:1140 start_codon:yes stop_codon:yes gene_type:complete